jgi:hypothetical protein
MDLFKRNNGAVTVFLVIILVPCMVVSFCFVDLSRLWLASGVSSASADMALNSVLTNYDAELQNLYGLMASATSSKDACEKAEGYYKQLLTSQGLSEDAAAGMAADMADLIRANVSSGGGGDASSSGGSASDGSPVVSGSGFITPVEGASLANPTLLRNQIVEFMKYRAPIDLTLNGIDLLTQLGNHADAIKDSDGDKKIIERKQEYYESLEALLALLKEITDTIRNYEESYICKSFSDVKGETSTFRNKYLDLHQYFIRNYLQNNGVEMPEGKELSAATKLAVNRSVESINNSIKSYISDVESQRKALKDLDAKFKEVPGKLEECNRKRQAWADEANSRTTEIAKRDQVELQGESDDENLKSMMNIVDTLNNDYDKLVQVSVRVDTAIFNLDKVLEVLNEMGYSTRHPNNRGEWVFDASPPKRLRNIASLNDYKSLYSDYYKDLEPEEFDNRVSGTHGSYPTFAFTESNLSAINNTDIEISGYRGQSNKPGRCPFYEQLYDYFGGATDEEKSDANKGAKDKLKEKAKEEKEPKLEESIQVKNIRELDSSFPSGFADGSVDILGGLLSLAPRLATNLDEELYNLRDSLYTTEYVRNMFSYYTISKEQDTRKLPELLPNATVDRGLTLKSFNEINLIDANTRYAMNGELEYILYGKGGTDDIVAAGTSIFAVRLALNTPAAFLAFWNPANNTTARAIQAASVAAQTATAGIVPYPVFKIVFILALAVVESGLDLNDLMNGHAVLFYKSGSNDAKDWTCKIPTGTEIVNALDTLNGVGDSDHSDGEKNTEQNIKDGKVCFFYSDYLYFFLLIAFSSDSTGLFYERVGDLIQANLRETGKKNTDFLMSTAHVYYQLNTTVEVKPLMLALPIAANYTEEKDISSWSIWRFTERVYRGYQ